MTTRLQPGRLLGVLTVLLVGGSVACDLQHQTASPAAPTSTTNGTASTLQMVGMWTSAAPTLGSAAPNVQGCGGFQWNITSQTATTANGTFSMTCQGGVTLAGTGNAQLSGSNVQVSVNGAGNLPGIGSCPFAVGGTGQMQGTDALTIPYSGTTCLGPVSGTETLHRSQVLPTPTPTPTPSPTPHPTPTPAPGAGGGVDGINMSQAAIMDNPPDLPSWAVTANITLIDFSTGRLVVDFDKRDGPNRWPDVPFGTGSLEYTLGMCLNISGQWYCSAAIQFWYGRDLAAGGDINRVGQDWFYDSRWGPMQGHQPASGEMVGIFVAAGNLRDSGISIAKERSAVVLIPWGQNYSR